MTVTISSGSGDSNNPYESNDLFGSLNVSDKNSANGTLTLEQMLSARNGAEGSDNTIKRPPNPGEFERYILSGCSAESFSSMAQSLFCLLCATCNASDCDNPARLRGAAR